MNIKSVWVSNSNQPPQPPPPQQVEQTIRIDGPFLGESPNDSFVKGTENNIFFYSDINTISCAEVNRLLSEMDLRLQFAKNLIGEEYIPTIHLRVNSGGGSLFDGIAVLDRLRNLKSNVYTYVEGGVASAATLLTIVGKKRFIGKHSMMLIHQLSSFNCGTFHQLEDGQANNRRFMALVKDIYKTYTKLPMKKIDEILKHDIWFSAQECIEYGLADEII